MTGRVFADGDRKSVRGQWQEECSQTVTGRVLGDSDRKSVRRR